MISIQNKANVGVGGIRPTLVHKQKRLKPKGIIYMIRKRVEIFIVKDSVNVILLNLKLALFLLIPKVYSSYLQPFKDSIY